MSTKHSQVVLTGTAVAVDYAGFVHYTIPELLKFLHLLFAQFGFVGLADELGVGSHLSHCLLRVLFSCLELPTKLDLIKDAIFADKLRLRGDPTEVHAVINRSVIISDVHVIVFR